MFETLAIIQRFHQSYYLKRIILFQNKDHKANPPTYKHNNIQYRYTQRYFIIVVIFVSF